MIIFNSKLNKSPLLLIPIIGARTTTPLVHKEEGFEVPNTLPIE